MKTICNEDEKNNIKSSNKLDVGQVHEVVAAPGRFDGILLLLLGLEDGGNAKKIN